MQYHFPQEDPINRFGPGATITGHRALEGRSLEAAAHVGAVRFRTGMVSGGSITHTSRVSPFPAGICLAGQHLARRLQPAAGAARRCVPLPAWHIFDDQGVLAKFPSTGPVAFQLKPSLSSSTPSYPGPSSDIPVGQVYPSQAPGPAYRVAQRFSSQEGQLPPAPAQNGQDRRDLGPAQTSGCLQGGGRQLCCPPPVNALGPWP